MTKVFEMLKHEEMHGKGVTTNSQPLLTESPPMKRGAFLGIEEAIVGLYQTLEATLPDPPLKIIQFIGSREGEGTSTIVRELARVSALRMNKSVLIVDADKTRPIQHHSFGLSPQGYIEDAIRNGGSTEGIFCQSGDKHLFIGLLSREGTSISELLDSRDINGFFDKLRKQFDLVLIDSPSVTTSPDSLSLCPRVDGVVLVVEAENTRWPVAEAMRDRIVRTGGNILGVVLNKRQYHIPEFIYRKL